MKRKTTKLEVRRRRLDYFFSKLVTFFGILVLATFATLILHILGNTVPLLQSTEFSLKNQYSSDLTRSSFGVTVLNGEWLNLSEQQCSIVVSGVLVEFAAKEKIYKKFEKDCQRRFVKLTGERRDLIAWLEPDGILEVFQLTQGGKQLMRVASVQMPEHFSSSSVEFPSMKSLSQSQKLGSSMVANYKASSDEEINAISIHDNLLYIRTSNTNKANSLGSAANKEDINSATSEVGISPAISDKIYISKFNQTEPPHMYMLEQPSLVYPLLKKQLLVHASGQNLSLRNFQNETIQKLSLSDEIVSLASSPSELDLFAFTKKGRVIRFTLVNMGGQFIFRETYTIDSDIEFSSNVNMVFDLPNNLAMFISPPKQSSKNDKAQVPSTELTRSALFNFTTGELQDLYESRNQVAHAHYNSGQLVVSSDELISVFEIDNLHGLTSIQQLFGKNDYSAYPDKAYVWQTSVSSEYQTPKYSVTPLIMGSLKASILALIVALPLALGGAIYTSYYASKGLRNVVKPTIEMLEAIPSVIIGFIAAVWLAPFAENHLLSIFSLIITLPFLLILLTLLHTLIHNKMGHTQFKHWQWAINISLLILAFLVIVGLSILFSNGLSYSAGSVGSYVESLTSNFTLSKTAIVVSLALGVAIAPTIYTLIDDALFEVPEGVKQASFALGATKIQTLLKVVLVVAFPSIISAIMLGFGRAFGETMIVLMVTGNTPIANWDLLAGLRTLTSNLAIELQEAPVDSTSYYILFLTASILFVFTFVVNTLAALVKRRTTMGGN